MVHPSTRCPPLRLNVCPRCEYSLAAHRAEGTCPECGRPYDAEEVVLYGYGLGWRGSGRGGRPAGDVEFIVGTALSAALVLCLAAAQNRRLAAVWMVLIGACAAREVWRRYAARNGEPLVQLKLTPHGFHQGCRQLGAVPFERSDTAPLEPWDPRLIVRITPLDAGRAQIVIVRPGEGPSSLDRTLVNADVAMDGRYTTLLRERIARWTADYAMRCGRPREPADSQTSNTIPALGR